MLSSFIYAASLLAVLAPQSITTNQSPQPSDPVPSSVILVDQSAQPSVGAIVIDEVARRALYDYYQRHLQEYQTSPGYDGHENENEDGNSHGNSHGNGNGNGHGKNKGGLPPGLAKKSTLPPGLQKQLARNGHLPPGLEYRSLPPDLLVQLPPMTPGYRYVILDDRVMLIRAATNVIMDILQVPGL
jgi:hypothetical protein